MRGCRKLISMIVMMAMLATMTPYQALATETPTDPAVQETQPVVEEEGQQDTEEAIPEVQDASKDEQKEPEESNEAAPSEASSEVAPGSDAVDSSSTNTDVKPAEDEKPEENETPEESTASEPAGTVDNLVLKLGDSDELELKIDGSFAADSEITLKEMEEDDVSEQKDRMTELLKKKVDSLQGVLLMDKNGEPAILRQNGMTLTVRGSMLPEEGLVFAFLDEEGEMKIVSDFEKSDTDDGVCYKFTADSVAALFVASAKTAYPAFAQENVAVAGTDITISVDAPEGAFPEGIQMRVSLKETPEAVLEAANAELAKEAAQENSEQEEKDAKSAGVAGTEVTQKDAVTFNIEFYLPNDPETEIEPLVPISVTFGNIALEGDTLEVYHSDDSQEGEVEVEKVLDGVENTDVLTVDGLEKFSDYTVLAKKNLLGADNSEGAVKLYFNGQDEPESGEGVYSDLSTNAQFPFTIEGNFPANATNKQIDITLAKGLTWRSIRNSTGGYDLVYTRLDKNQVWYKSIAKTFYPTVDYSGSEDQNFHNRSETIPDGNGTIDTVNGTLTYTFNDDLTWFKTVGFNTASYGWGASPNFIGRSYIGSVDDPITVTLSYRDENGELQVKTTKISQMNFTFPYNGVQTSGSPYNVTTITGGDGKSRYEIVEGGKSVENEYRWLWTTTPASGFYEAWNLSDYYAAFLVPKDLEYIEKSITGVTMAADSPNPVEIPGGQTYVTEDGKSIEIGEDEKLLIFNFVPHAKEQSKWTSGGGHYYPVFLRWDFSAFENGDMIDVVLKDVGLRFYNMDEYLSAPTRDTVARYQIVPEAEEVFANSVYNKHGQYSGSQRENASTGGSVGYCNYTLYMGAPEWGSYEQVDNVWATNHAAIFSIGNRGTGDSVPKKIDMVFDTNNKGGIGVVQQRLVYSKNDYGNTVNVSFRTWDGINADSVSEMKETEVTLNAGGTALVITSMPGYEQGQYFKEIHYQIGSIPAKTPSNITNMYGEHNLQVLTDDAFAANADGIVSTITVSDAVEPEAGQTAHTVAVGTTYGGLYGRHRIEGINPSGSNTVTAGNTATINARIFVQSAGGSMSWGTFIDELYVISPYGAELTNWSFKNSSNTAFTPDISEISTEGMNLPEAYRDTARVYKVDFNKYTEEQDVYDYRMVGIVKPAAPATYSYRARNEITMTYRMKTEYDDPLGTVGNLVWAKVHYPHTTDDEGRELPDLSKVAFGGIVPVKDSQNYHLVPANAETWLKGGVSLNILGTEDLTTQTYAAPAGTDEYYQWTGNDDETVLNGNKGIDYRMTITNSTSNDVSTASFFIPVPKQDVTWNSKYQPGGAWNYNMYLLDKPEITQASSASYTVYYSTAQGGSDPADWGSDAWTPWPEGSLTTEQLRAITFVKLTANDFDMQKTDQVDLKFGVDEYDEEDVGKIDTWASSYTSRLSTAETNKGTIKSASILAPASIGGTVFEDLKNDGTYDPEDSDLPDTGIAAVTVEAWREVDGTLTKIDSTETDENGYYLFENLIEGKEYTIIVTNPDTDKYFKFSVNGAAAARFAPETDQSKASASEKAQVAETGRHLQVDCGLLQEVKIPVTKIWADADNQDGVRPTSIEVKLKGTVEAAAEDSGSGETEEETVVEKAKTLTAADADKGDETGNTWIYTFEGLTAYEKGKQIDYSVEETKTTVITGTDGAGTYAMAVQGSAEEGFEITNTHTPEVRDITVTKVWEDFDNMNSTRPSSISVQLYADGTASGDPVSISESKNWTYTWTGVDKFKGGSEINYTVDEVGTIPGYRKADQITGDMKTGFTITNTLVVTTADAQKLWSNADGTTTAPVGAKVTFTLKAGEEATGFTVELDGTPETTAPTVTGGYESAPWKATFVNLPKYKAGTDTEVEYTIAETSGYTGYTASPAEPVASGGSITNTQDVTSLKVIKVWEDAGDQDGKRPETITVKLLDGKDEITSQDIEIDRDTDRYEHTFTSLPIYVTDEEGVQHKAVYSVAEEKITTGDYSAAYDTIKAEEKEIEIQITNSYTPEKTSVTVDKVWDDANDQDALRPESIQVQLYNGDTAVREPVTLTAEEGWTYTWTELDKYSPHGKEIKYSVKEVEPVPEYEAEIKEIDDTNKIIINNKHEVHKTEVTVSKVWEDNDNKTGARPAELLVTLYADGEAVEEAALNEKNSWKHTFENLDVNKIVDGKGGNAIVYTVEEEKVNAYYGEITKTEEEKGITYTIKNTYAPAKHDPPVKKVITGDKPGEAETFYFTLTPVSNTAGLDEMPMPEGSSGSSKTVTVTGEGETEIGIITFNAPGQYIYRVVETAGSNSNYTYDGSTYQIIYDVTEGENSLQASRKYLKDGKEVEEIVFTNEYKEPTKPSEPSKPSKPSKHSRSNNTGDSANGALWALMLLLAGGALAGTIWFKRRKKI